MKYTSDVEVDNMDIPSENCKESCAAVEQGNLTSSLSPLHPIQHDTDQPSSSSAANISGDYLKMGGGFCIDEEDEVPDES